MARNLFTAEIGSMIDCWFDDDDDDDARNIFRCE